MASSYSRIVLSLKNAALSLALNLTVQSAERGQANEPGLA
ncbi:MAG: hypothetical protein ACI832_001997 [Rheinheimera aquimaris]|jgi:hypothetical protein